MKKREKNSEGTLRWNVQTHLLFKGITLFRSIYFQQLVTHGTHKRHCFVSIFSMCDNTSSLPTLVYFDGSHEDISMRMCRINSSQNCQMLLDPFI